MSKETYNVAAMRELIKELRDIVHNAFWSKDGKVKGDVLNALRRANVALDAPLRQCDIGTDNEQIRRWKEFCDRYEVDRSPESFARWAQVPYFEEGGER